MEIKLGFGYDHDPEFYEQYYHVPGAIEFLKKPVPEGYKRWRCLGCLYPMDVKSPELDEIVPATCCGSCGYCLNRPIEEIK